MNLSILVNGEERKNYIDLDSFKKEDIITSQVDILSFTTKKWGSKSWKPQLGDEIVVYYEGEKIFGGIIVTISESATRGGLLEYDVECKDYTHQMDQQLVVKNYQNTTVSGIISDLIENYLPSGFTMNNVKCTISVENISFNYEQPSKVLQQLAELVGYYWYVDYDKDIHFFSKIGEPAPFDLEDDNDTYVYDSLKIEEDLSQLRNVVYVRGGEYVASLRLEKYVSDGEQTSFPLAYKYSEKPGVDIDGAQKTVGIDGLDDFSDGYDCLWSFNGKYIRFQSEPTSGSVVTISGTPLFPILVVTADDESINQYGTYEHKIVDKTIKSKATARERAKAELQTYSRPLKVGKFITYTSGLRSGQRIRINSTSRGIDEYFIIDRVITKIVGANKMVWEVEISSIKKYGIIELLQSLLLEENKKIKIDENEILEKAKFLSEEVTITEEISRHTESQDHQNVTITELIRKDPWTPLWVLGPYFPTSDDDNKRPMKIDISFYVY